jgi:hypothetical protein
MFSVISEINDKIGLTTKAFHSAKAIIDGIETAHMIR